MEKKDYDIIIKSICKKIYNILKYNTSIYKNFQIQTQLNKLNKINKKTDFKYIQFIRSEIGNLYKTYIIFCQKNDYKHNVKDLQKIKKFYFEINYTIGNNLLFPATKNNSQKLYDNLEKYIDELDATYGGQTEKYIKRLGMKNLDDLNPKIKKICNSKSMITSERKKMIINIFKEKMEQIKSDNQNQPGWIIKYNSSDAKYILIKKEKDKTISRKKIKFNSDFSDIEILQKNAIKSLRRLNYGISIYEELELTEKCLKYTDPFLLTIFIKEKNLDYAKLYLRQLNCGDPNVKDKLPFKIIYKIDTNFNNGVLTPIRNKIIAIIAERNSVFVSKLIKTHGE